MKKTFLVLLSVMMVVAMVLTLTACNKCVNGHTWDNGTETKAATCGKDGEILYVCEVCLATKTEPIPATGDHDWGEWRDSSVEGKQERECSVCRTVDYKDAQVTPDCEHTDLTETPAVAPDCTNNGNIRYWQCDNCHKYFADDKASEEITFAETVDPAVPTAHKYQWHEQQTAKDCTETGIRAHYECTVCHKYFDEQYQQLDNIIIPASHNLSGLKPATVGANCKTAGTVAHYECLTCEKWFADEEAKTELIGDARNGEYGAHTLGSLIPAEAPTCTSDGVIAHYQCSSCNKLFKDGDAQQQIETSLDPKLGHSYPAEWTPDQQGHHVKVCERNDNTLSENCKYTYTETADMKSHTATCGTCEYKYTEPHDFGTTGKLHDCECGALICGEGNVGIVWKDEGYSDAQVISSKTVGDSYKFTLTLSKGSNNSSSPSYWNTGTSLRLYGGNTMTINAATNTVITKIVFTYGSGDNSNTISVNVGQFLTNTWTGNADSVTFTIGGTSSHRRIASITIYYEADTHVWDEQVQTTDPTCDKDGTVTKTCIRCGKVKTETGATATGHSWEIDREKGDDNSGWTWNISNGSAVVTVSLKCSKCSTTHDEIATVNYEQTNAPTCTQQGAATYTASVDYQGFKDSDTRDVTLSTIPHSYSLTWTNTDEQGHYHECTVCQAKDLVIPHTYEELGYDIDDDDEYHISYCDTCEYESREKHTWELVDLGQEVGHQQQCNKCDAVNGDVQNHNFGDSGTDKCECGAISGHNHDFTGEWKSDVNGHWKECPNDQVQAKNAAHTPKWVEYDGGHRQICEICEYVIITEKQNHVLPTDIDDYLNDDSIHYTTCKLCKADITHDNVYTPIDNATHKIGCSIEGCPFEINDKHDFTGEGNKCVHCNADKPAEPTVVAVFEMGTATSDSGTQKTSYTETNKGYTLSLTGKQMYEGAGGTLKLGSSSTAGEFTFTVPSNIISVKIYIGQYNGKNVTVTINNTAYTITENGADGVFKCIEIDTTTTNSISLVTSKPTNGDIRARIDKIEWIALGTSGGGETEIPNPDQHGDTCESVCETCQGCTNTDCQEDVCGKKCECEQGGGGSTQTKTQEMVASAQGWSNSSSLDGKSTTAGDVTISLAKSTGSNPPAYYTSGTALRLYANNTITFTVGEGMQITEISFNCTSGYYQNLTPSTGTYSTTTNSWTGTAQSVTLTVPSGQHRIVSLTITYTVTQ